MKAEKVRTKTPDELDADLADLKKEQFNLRFQKATGQLEKIFLAARRFPEHGARKTRQPPLTIQ